MAKEELTKNQVHNLKEFQARKTLWCQKCTANKDEQLLYCNVCQKDKPVSNFPPNTYCHRARFVDRGTLTCNTCAANKDEKLLYCKVCQEDQPVDNFPPDIDRTRARSAKRGTLTCNKCATPTCTNTQCRACRTCYSTRCRAKPCNKHHSLTHSQLPHDRQQLNVWKCPTCTYTCCVVCGKEPAHQQTKSKWLKSEKQHTCAECNQKALAEKDKKYK